MKMLQELQFHQQAQGLLRQAVPHTEGRDGVAAEPWQSIQQHLCQTRVPTRVPTLQLRSAGTASSNPIPCSSQEKLPTAAAGDRGDAGSGARGCGGRCPLSRALTVSPAERGAGGGAGAGASPMQRLGEPRVRAIACDSRFT